jgi:hypothetical protein
MNGRPAQQFESRIVFKNQINKGQQEPGPGNYFIIGEFGTPTPVLNKT